MSTKFTQIKKGEKIIGEWKDGSAWLTRKMGLVSESAGVAGHFPGKWHPGTLFLTSHRIIFESFDGKTSNEISHDEIDNSHGKNASGATHGEIELYCKNLLIRKYTLYCGAEMSTKLNQEFYTREIIDERLMNKAKEYEKHLDYDGAIEIYGKIDKPAEAGRVRKLKAEQGAVKVTQKVVHGDEVTKTEIKDSVLNRSNVSGGKSSKAEELREAKSLFEEGLIDDDEFKQMKKEILGK